MLSLMILSCAVSSCLHHPSATILCNPPPSILQLALSAHMLLPYLFQPFASFSFIHSFISLFILNHPSIYLSIYLTQPSSVTYSLIQIRCRAWKEVTGKEIKFVNLDIHKEYDLLVDLIRDEQPDSIVHFAEQRAAPYSMKNSKTKRYTIDNNVGGSNNLCCAVIDADVDAHIVHLGTMGVYGYGTSGGEIPEGYIDVKLPGGRDANILHPAYPGSVYHATKCLDALLWQFYQKNDNLRITDLHHGIVWDYDGDYGTVLNRFLMQGAMGVPLTVYGTGGQTRAFIHISDTARCIELAVNNPPKSGERVEIFNQVAETCRVSDIAQMVAKMTGVEVNFIPNPRQEAAENELDVANRKFCNLGLDPITLDTGLFDEVTEVVKKYKSRCDPTKILPASFWNKKRAEECAGLDPRSIKIQVDEPEKAASA
jgi:UDP-sulfoquinovose synthase